jgi:hypothetical protein
MSKVVHLIYVGIFVVVTSIVFIALSYKGISYYTVSLEERFYHADHNNLKPSGYVGHSLGIAGSLCIIIGVGTYMARKRYRSLSHLGLVKYWLEFHIFMCILGSIMIVFHTAFKFGGLAAISFWSMVTVFVSGIAGRIIYLQIPRTMEGHELDQKEVREMRNDIVTKIRSSHDFDEESFKLVTYSIENRSGIYAGNKLPGFLKNYFNDRTSVNEVKGYLKENKISGSEYSRIVALVKDDIRLGRTIERLDNLKNLFRYWHVFHLPFAILMLIFMILHVIVTVALGYSWIF